MPVYDSKLVARPRPAGQAYVPSPYTLQYGNIPSMMIDPGPGHTYCNIAPPRPLQRMHSHTYLRALGAVHLFSSFQLSKRNTPKSPFCLLLLKQRRC